MPSTFPIEGDAGAGQPPGPAAHPPPHGDPPAEGGAGVPPPQGDAGQGHVRAGGVWRGVRPSLRHPHEGRLRPLHPAQAPGTDQDEHQLATLLAVLRFHYRHQHHRLGLHRSPCSVLSPVGTRAAFGGRGCIPLCRCVMGRLEEQVEFKRCVLGHAWSRQSLI